MTLPALQANAPGFDWEPWLAALQAPAGAFAEVVVRQPSFVAAAAQLWAQRPLEQWKAWLAIRTASALRRLPDRRRRRGGLRVLRPHAVRHAGAARALEARCVACRGRAGRGGRQALRRAALPRRRPRSGWSTLVANLVEAYRQSISTLDWMGPATRERALAKLARFTPKIGYPDEWKDYSALEIRADDLLGNVAAGGRVGHRLRAGQDRQADRPRRVADDPADGQRLLPPADERDRVPGRDPAAAVLRRRGRRRGELRRHRRRHRPRDRARLRRPGQQVRRRGHADRLVGAGRPGRVRAAREGADRRSTTRCPPPGCPSTTSTAR